MYPKHAVWAITFFPRNPWKSLDFPVSARPCGHRAGTTGKWIRPQAEAKATACRVRVDAMIRAIYVPPRNLSDQPYFFKEPPGGIVMPRVKTIVITGFGTNCEVESAFAATQAGSDVTDIAYFSDVTAGRTRLADYNLLIFPGGFLDGDDLGAAQAAALRWTHAKTRTGEAVIDQLKAFFEAGGLILGICNGFQLLVKIGLLPGLFGRYFVRELSLSNNDSGRFEDRWVTLAANPACPCVFTRGISRIDLPVRHGEGKLIPKNQAVLDALWPRTWWPCNTPIRPRGSPRRNIPKTPTAPPWASPDSQTPRAASWGLCPIPRPSTIRPTIPAGPGARPLSWAPCFWKTAWPTSNPRPEPPRRRGEHAPNPRRAPAVGRGHGPAARSFRNPSWTTTPLP